MKKTLYSLMALCALSFGLISCDDDDAIDHGKHAQLPEQQAAGTYVGSLSVYETDLESEPAVVEATVTITAGKDPYTATFSMESGNTSANGDICTNFVWTNNNFLFASIPVSYNAATPELNSIANGSSAAVVVNGDITDGVMTASYSKTVKSGRSSKTYFYKFSGKK